MRGSDEEGRLSAWRRPVHYVPATQTFVFAPHSEFRAPRVPTAPHPSSPKKFAKIDLRKRPWDMLLYRLSTSGLVLGPGQAFVLGTKTTDRPPKWHIGGSCNATKCFEQACC